MTDDFTPNEYGDVRDGERETKGVEIKRWHNWRVRVQRRDRTALLADGIDCGALVLRLDLDQVEPIQALLDAAKRGATAGRMANGYRRILYGHSAGWHRADGCGLRITQRLAGDVHHIGDPQ